MQSGYIHLTEYQSGQLLNTHEKKHDCTISYCQNGGVIILTKKVDDLILK